MGLFSSFKGLLGSAAAGTKKLVGRNIGSKVAGFARELGSKAVSEAAKKAGDIARQKFGEQAGSLVEAGVGKLGEKAVDVAAQKSAQLAGQAAGKLYGKVAPKATPQAVEDDMGISGLFGGSARSARAIPQMYPGSTVYQSKMMPSAPMTASNRTAGRMATSRMAGGAPYETMYGGSAPIGSYRSLIMPNQF